MSCCWNNPLYLGNGTDHEGVVSLVPVSMQTCVLALQGQAHLGSKHSAVLLRPVNLLREC